ncbi:hypothetical protein O3M35_001557 [Rhynocoris fuscipes]|uniref:Uncharacterized protein n=1 Tax=Rhynocoris fuscipes TaxID=488301 RepID=A0AAW1CPE2_9HEMI
MARNAEKAMTTLARWRAAQLGEGDTQKQRRPFLASECTDLPQAEKWRLQIIREIARKVSQIQNAGLGEFRIRDLNDEINKLLREKSHWEVQIKELGGPDYSKSGPKMLDHDGKEVPGNRGYKYFGAARQLPGVRELFEQAPPPPPHKTRGEMMREVDASYYGYMDDEDGLLIPLEEEQEKLAIAKAVAQWTIKKEKSLNNEQIEEEEEDQPEEDIYKVSAGEESEDSDTEITAKTLASFKAHVPVPTQKEVEEAILERKKQELLARFAPEYEEMEYEYENNNDDDSNPDVVEMSVSNSTERIPEESIVSNTDDDRMADNSVSNSNITDDLIKTTDEHLSVIVSDSNETISEQLVSNSNNESTENFQQNIISEESIVSSSVEEEKPSQNSVTSSTINDELSQVSSSTTDYEKMSEAIVTSNIDNNITSDDNPTESSGS